MKQREGSTFMAADAYGVPIEILLVEDNPGDVRFTMEILKESKIYNKVAVVKDGVDALAYLRRQHPFTQATLPDLILLDLNLPRKDGREVLRELKADPLLSVLSVVLLTSSDAEQDLIDTYNLPGNCYITKPITLLGLIAAVQVVGNWGFTIVKK
jgi:two-component system, chemotaxis family, response regulator Rcp1